MYLHDILYVPEIRRNLVFILCLNRLGYSVQFKNLSVLISYDNYLICTGLVHDGLYALDMVSFNNISNLSSIAYTFDSVVDDIFV